MPRPLRRHLHPACIACRLPRPHVCQRLWRLDGSADAATGCRESPVEAAGAGVH